MSRVDTSLVGVGILFLTAGLALVYFGYFAAPFFAVFPDFPVDIIMMLAPYLLVVLGVSGIYGGLRPSSKKGGEVEQSETLLPHRHRLPTQQSECVQHAVCN